MTPEKTQEFTEKFMKEVCKSKQRRVESGDLTGLPGIVAIFRDDDHLAWIRCDIGRAHTWLPHVLWGFNAEMFLLQADITSTNLEKNPVTGEDWEDGDMEVVARTYSEENREHNWVREMLLFQRTQIDQETHDHYTQGFEIVPPNALIWTEAETNLETYNRGFISSEAAFALVKGENRQESVMKLAERFGLKEKVKNSALTPEERTIMFDSIYANTARGLHRENGLEDIKIMAAPGTPRAAAALSLAEKQNNFQIVDLTNAQEALS